MGYKVYKLVRHILNYRVAVKTIAWELVLDALTICEVFFDCIVSILFVESSDLLYRVLRVIPIGIETI